MKYPYDIKIEAPSEKEAEIKIKALCSIQKRLSAAVLEKLAHVVKHDPIKLALAKRYLGV
jgi:hypothetical protein